jgi:two-component system NtrC family sensor kinase
MLGALGERDKKIQKQQMELLQSEKLAAIGQLGAGVAHELNNPMAGILGYTQFMLDVLSKENVKVEDIYTFKKYLQHIESGTSRCREIISNLLQFARKPTENFEPLIVNKILSDTLNLIEHQLIVNNIEVIKNLTKDVNRVVGDSNQLQQVFTNIIVNAQQAMPKGGKLSISTRNQASTVEIEFKDTGCGIANENIDRIFEPFFTTKLDWKGTGLGLSICYDIVKNHNGRIRVSSKVGEGTIFTVILPSKE